MMQVCADQRRRNAVAAHASLNGIDAIEVVDRSAPTDSPRQRTLLVHCLKGVPALRRDNVTIEGGERVRDVRAEWVGSAATVDVPDVTPAERTMLRALPAPDRVLVIRTDVAGDYSHYTLRLVQSANDPTPAAGFDPRMASLAFSFKIECPTEFDCAIEAQCGPAAGTAPDIDYLARDYQGFRTLILDRLAHLCPDWESRNAADIGVVLAEILAHAGDQLSYQQDAVATEAYLATARRRVSVRRHARLVDYHLHDGCNARAWIIVEPLVPTVEMRKGEIQFLTRVEGLPSVIAPDSRDLKNVLEGRRAEVFEPLHNATLYAAHVKMSFYSWGDRRCCLPRGSTRATLDGHFPDLRPGDVLIFEEVIGPLTGEASDANPEHRHAVRLTFTRALASGVPLTDPLTNVEITEVAWHAQDALPFPLCVSSQTDEARGDRYVDGVSVAYGNVVLIDHGRSLKADITLPPSAADAVRPLLFRPSLEQPPITQAAETFDADGSATRAALVHTADVVPIVSLAEAPHGEPWTARRDLLASKGRTRDFVVELEEDGLAYLRFGDNVNGRRPEPGTTFGVSYRVGNGTAGNVGADSLTHAVTAIGAIGSVRNPLAAVGGQPREHINQVRRRAPHIFRRQERAVTPDDYARMTERQVEIQRASARFRWTGSWHTVFVAVDRYGGKGLTDTFEDSLHTHIDRYRMTGHDVNFDNARFVPLEIGLHVCVTRDHYRTDVKAALLKVLSGLFHPDRLTFGQTIFTSTIYEAVHRVPGVASAEITLFRRQGIDEVTALDEGRLTLGLLEIPRLDNDPNFPERGVLHLTLGGGK